MKRVPLLFLLIVLLILCSACGTTTAESEPNNSFARSQRVTTVATVEGAISSLHDQDYYRFVVFGRKWSSMKLVASLEHSSKVDLVLDIYRNGKRVTRVDDYAARSAQRGRKPVPQGELTKEQFANLTLVPGTYHLVVRRAFRSGGKYPVDYVLRLQREQAGGFAELEPNNSFKYANPLIAGADMIGFCSPGNNPFVQDRLEVDMYKLEIQSTNKGLLDIELSGVPGIDLTISVYDKDKKLLRHSDSYKEHLGEKITKMAVDPQAIYYIKIATRKPFSANHTMPYTLRTMLTEYKSGFEMEPNDSIDKSNPIKLTEPVSGYLSQLSDKDFYKFLMPRPGNFMFSVRVKGVPDVNIALALYDSDGYLIRTFDTAGSGEPEYIVNYGLKASRANQPFYIAVFSKQGTNNREEYRMVLRLLEANLQGEFEANDKRSQANPLLLNVQKMGFIFPQEDVDYYSFKLESPRNVHLELSGVPAMRLNLTLVTKDGVVIKEVKQKIAQGNLKLSAALTSAGLYYVRVNALSRAKSNAREPYSLIVREGAALTVPSSSSSSVSATTNTLGR